MLTAYLLFLWTQISEKKFLALYAWKLINDVKTANQSPLHCGEAEFLQFGHLGKYLAPICSFVGNFPIQRWPVLKSESEPAAWQNDKDNKFCSEEDALDTVGDGDLVDPAATGWRWKCES